MRFSMPGGVVREGGIVDRQSDKARELEPQTTQTQRVRGLKRGRATKKEVQDEWATYYGSGQWSDEESPSESQGAEMGEEVEPSLRKRPPPKKPALKSPQKLERPRGEEKKI